MTIELMYTEMKLAMIPCTKFGLILIISVKVFSSSFIPYGNLTVDEGVCGFRGRIIFRVYMKNKPKKYGITLFVVADSCTGYMLKMEAYTGKADYFDKGYTEYMDRYYSSPVVFDYLWQRKTKAVGTCMPNRKELPKNTIVRKKINKQEMVYMRRKHLLCIKWKCTIDVLVLSTAHQARTTDEIKA
ncbi:hypothetical protein PR048_019513 [Dryococelus australis]|uniref:PiggyBac transposable element-derived protein domain-containing protein n=1 Tax=Dryococelus australis TaxID=614101 RepID=A0ABQ9H3N7_9NEOP|nr:hypothetical protein PR048_019513 [Dryococelus australis]